MNVRLRILTAGRAEIAGRCVANALMGSGFHWQRSYPLLLPAEAGIVSADPLTVEMPVEIYLRGVVTSEMNPLAPAEFLKAHAVIARSWVLGKIMRRHPEGSLPKADLERRHIITWDDTAQHSGFHVCSDDHCQRYQGERKLPAAIEKALESTRGLVLYSAGGEIVDARYSKCCGGTTELFSTCWQDVDYSYLQPVECPWCDLSATAPERRDELLHRILKDYDSATTPDFCHWHREVPASLVRQRIGQLLGTEWDVGEISDLQPVKHGPSGRISQLRIEGSHGNIEVGKELLIRRLLSRDTLLSSAFEVEKRAGGFLLHGHGWGHGVGLCQIGGAVMAEHGYGMEQILSHYYPGATVRAEKSGC